MLMGATLNPINSSVIATALVSIAVALRIPMGQTSILISSLYLTSAVAQPTAGRLSEEFGPRRVFLAGAATVLVAGIVGGLARNLTALVVARVLIGLGTSAGYPAAMLLLHRLGAGGQPRVPGPRDGELPALLQVARRALPAGAPVGVLLDGQVPHVPGVPAVVPQHRFLGGRGEQPVPGHANTLASTADISRGGDAALPARPEGRGLHAAIPMRSDEPGRTSEY